MRNIGQMNTYEQTTKNVSRRSKSIRLATVSFGAAWAYILCVFVLKEDFLGVQFGLKAIAVLMVAGLIGFYCLVPWLVRRRLLSETRLVDLTLVTSVALLFLLAGDVAYSAYLASLVSDHVPPSERLLYDRNARIGEWYPRLYYPTQQNFRLHKPNFFLVGENYGQLYTPELMQSPTLAAKVFERQHVSISIDQYGFRATTSPAQCHIFTLGDSFTFGWGVSDGKTWSALLGHTLGEPVYNLGIHDSSPKQEFLLLKYILEKDSNTFAVRRLIWMIFEGNDLEDSYKGLRPSEAMPGIMDRLFKGTVIASLARIPFAIKHESIINKLKTGQVRLALPFRDREGNSPYMVDGIRLMHPLYYSPQHGFVLFRQKELDRASKPKSYLTTHPHRRLLDQVFKDMAMLAERYQFEVTVAIAPTVNRLYAPYFDLTELTQPPHFIDYVEKLAHDMGFTTVNLFAAMQPYARQELLYFRDDDHWNERGHQVAAEVIAHHLTVSGIHTLNK